MSRYNAREYASRHYEPDGAAKSTCYSCHAPSKEVLCQRCDKFFSLEEPDNMSQSVVDFQRRKSEEAREKEAFQKALSEKKGAPDGNV